MGSVEMKFISWNVNGLRACMNKGFKEFMDSVDADVFCVQETNVHSNKKPRPYQVEALKLNFIEYEKLYQRLLFS